MIGSGNWGTVAARMAAQSVAERPDIFEPQVDMWVFEEQLPINESELKRAAASFGMSSEQFTAAEMSKLMFKIPLGLNSTQVADIYQKQQSMTLSAFAAAAKSHTRPLSQVINSANQNVKYLPGIQLPSNLRANPSLISTATGASMLIFVSPHQFIMGSFCL